MNEKLPPSKMEHTSTVSFAPRFGITQKGVEYAGWKMRSFGVKKEDGTWDNLGVDCFSTRLEVVALLHKVHEKSDILWVFGDVKLTLYQGKMILSIFVTEAELCDADQPVNQPAAPPNDEEIPF